MSEWRIPQENSEFGAGPHSSAGLPVFTLRVLPFETNDIVPVQALVARDGGSALLILRRVLFAFSAWRAGLTGIGGAGWRVSGIRVARAVLRSFFLARCLSAPLGLMGILFGH
jgi:hypothetical protein